MNQAFLKETFRYCRVRGELFYKVRPHQSKNKPLKGIGTITDGGKRKYATLKGKRYNVARLIFLFHKGYLPEQVDHIDGNGLNNKIGNLRAATNSQNQLNKSAHRRNKSGYKGVYFCKDTGRWRADIMLNRKKTFIGRFDCKHKAAKAYNKMAKKLHGSFARLNHIKEAK